MTEWIKCKISDIGTVVGGATPPTKKTENYENGNISWITPKDLSSFNGRYIEHGERNITEVGLKSCHTQLMPKNSVLFSSRAPIGYVAIAAKEMCTNQGFKSIIPNENTDSLFLYYLLKYNKDKIENMGSGTTFKEVSGTIMNNIVVSVPTDKQIQVKISSFLGVIDDKIEENEKINNNLEQQTQAIYSRMFIEHRQESWSTGQLSDLISVKYGKDHKKLADGNYPVYGSGGIIRYVEKPLHTGESVLIPRKGTLNNVIYVNEAFWSVDTMFYTEMLHPNIAKFVYHFVKSKDLASLNAGSAVPSMTTNILNAMQLYIPDEKTLEKFENIVSPMYSAMQENTKESKILANTRDTLLPKLMSGELDVSDIDL